MKHAVCHLVRRDSSASKFDRVQIAFILALSLLAEPLNDEGGEETGVSIVLTGRERSVFYQGEEGRGEGRGRREGEEGERKGGNE